MRLAERADFHKATEASLAAQELNRTGKAAAEAEAEALGTWAHNVSINTAGLQALKTGTVFPDGTRFVVDLHEFTVDDGSYLEGARKALAVMVTDAKKYATRGGWGFQAWAGGDPGKPLVTDSVKQCFACHEPRKAHDCVYSTYIP